MPKSYGHDVFISYSKNDQPGPKWASEFVDALRDEGVRAWLDDHRLLPGEDWRYEIEEALRESPVVVFLVTPDSLNSAHVSFELGAAVAGHKTIIPIVAGNIESDQIPFQLRNLAILKESSPRVAAKRVAKVAKDTRGVG